MQRAELATQFAMKAASERTCFQEIGSVFDLHGGLHDGAGSVGVFGISFMLFEVSGHEIPKPKRMPGLHDRS